MSSALGQSNTPPDIQAVGDQFYCPLSQIPVATSFNIIDPDDTEINEFHIQISTGYVQGEDLLILTGTHPNVVSSWSEVEGKLSLGGIANAPVNYIDLIAAVNDVVFQSSSVNVYSEKFFSFTIGDANYLPLTGHYYEYVPSQGITWSNARDLAETYSYFGLQGYLATITSEEEDQICGEQVTGTGWIGGSDEETEGVWKWMTGPETGMVFWHVNATNDWTNYSNWNTGEPNNMGDEDYAHITAPNIGIVGSWNDLDNDGDPAPSDYHPQGFIVEYGGMPGDPVLDLSASTKITVNEITSTVGASRCGSGTVTLEAFSLAGTVLWFDAQTGGNQVGSGNSFTTPNLNATTNYYVLASVNGCIEGIRTPIVATVNEIPSITAVTDDLICDQGIGTLTATASIGTINWYANAIGGTSLATGNSFSTPSISTSTTYYVDATSNGCTSLARTPVTVNVQQTQLPTANILQSFCDLDNATISDLSITGSNIIWYDADTDGNVLSNSELLSSSMYYASQTINGCESLDRLEIEVVIYNTVDALQPSEIPILQECDSDADGNDTNGLTTFDLTQYDTILLNGSNASDFQVNYFTDAAYTNLITNPVAFSNTVQDTQTIYVRMNNNLDTSCFSDTSFVIQVDELPIIQSNITFRNCDEDGIPDGFTDFNLTEINDIITNGNSNGLSISYHLTSAEAENSSNAVNPIPFNNSTSNIVYARVENSNGCSKVSIIDLQVSTTSFVSGYMQELESCDVDADIDGLHVFDLTQTSQSFIDEFPTGQNLSVHYYENLIDAQLEQNEIVNQTNYVNQTPFSQVLYIRVESEDNGDCYGIGPHLTLTVHPRPEFEIDDNSIYCLNGSPIVLETFNPNDNYTYQWTDESGTVVSAMQTATVNSGGIYTVVATSIYGCNSFPETFNVIESAIADIDLDDVTIVDFSDNNTISINNDNNNLGIGEYEFALNNANGPYQDESFFDQIPAGLHDLYVRDKNGCGVATLQIAVSGFPRFFTPNGDGYNDTWNLKGWSNQFSSESRIFIYDRFGKLIKQMAPWTNGWDGTFNGSELNTTDFWFVSELVELDGTTRTLKGHFSLVR